MGTRSASARSAWLRRASSVKVPAGPRKATRTNARILTTSMDEPTLRQLLADVRSGAMSADDAVARLRRLPFADLGFARVDHHRALRQGLAEAVYAPGKTAEQCAALVEELLAEEGGGPVLLTRADESQGEASLTRNPGGARTASTVVWQSRPERPSRVLVITAGTADLPVAEGGPATLHAH